MYADRASHHRARPRSSGPQKSPASRDGRPPSTCTRGPRHCGDAAEWNATMDHTARPQQPMAATCLGIQQAEHAECACARHTHLWPALALAALKRCLERQDLAACCFTKLSREIFACGAPERTRGRTAGSCAALTSRWLQAVRNATSATLSPSREAFCQRNARSAESDGAHTPWLRVEQAHDQQVASGAPRDAPPAAAAAAAPCGMGGHITRPSCSPQLRPPPRRPTPAGNMTARGGRSCFTGR